MSDAVLIACIVCGTILCVSAFFAAFAGEPSTWQSWLSHRRALEKEAAEIKKLEAEHAMRCPRLGDTARVPR